MNKACYTCVSGKTKLFTVFRDGQKSDVVQISDTDTKIPTWYKEAGIYSPLAPQITCNPNYNWFLNRDLTPILPKSYKHSLTFSIPDVKKKIPMDVDPSNTWVAYWATDLRDYNRTEPIGPIEAYGSFENSGLAKADKKGFVTIYYDTPTPYMVEGIVYPPHIHFTFLKRDRTWRLNQTTMDIIPDIHLGLFKKLQTNTEYTLVNAVPSNIQQNIPGSLHIPSNTLPTKIDKVLQKNLSTKHSPIVVYCGNPECSASYKLMQKLLKLGYNNLIHYPGGLEEYFHL
jgi:hypothetical protein